MLFEYDPVATPRMVMLGTINFYIPFLLLPIPDQIKTGENSHLATE